MTLNGVINAKQSLVARTTLDLDYQHLAEATLKRRIDDFKNEDAARGRNVNNAALVALDPHNGEILALVGSADFFDESIGGALNMAVSPRQTGSAFKPFIYALALDQNVNNAALVVLDPHNGEILALIGRITVRWDTGRVKGDISGEVVLHPDDPAQPPVVLLLKGVVKPALEVLPSRAVFLSVLKGESIEQTVTMINNEERPLTITRLEPRGQHFLADLRAVDPGKVYQLVVRVTPETPPGRYSETLDVHTNQAERSPIKIAVNVLVKTELYVFPDMVDFGKVSLADLARTPSLIEAIRQKAVMNSPLCQSMNCRF